NFFGAQTLHHLIITRDTTVLKPQGLQIIPISPTTNRVVWLPSGEGDLRVAEIYRRPAGGGSAVLIGSAAAPLTFFDDTNVLPGTNFCYKIQAIDDLGNQSAFSDEVCPVRFGAGGAGDFSRTGGSVAPGNITSSQVADTVLVTPI